MSKTCDHHNHHNCLEELRADHEVILKELDLLEKAATGPKVDREQVEKFLHFTETFAEPHHKKEETVLFPELEKRGIPKDGGPIGVMLFEHEIKRGYVRDLREALEKNQEKQMKEKGLVIVDILREHIDKENNILYPMAESVLSKEDLESFAERCREIK